MEVCSNNEKNPQVRIGKVFQMLDFIIAFVDIWVCYRS